VIQSSRGAEHQNGGGEGSQFILHEKAQGILLDIC